MDIIIADSNRIEKAFLAEFESLDIEINDIGGEGNDNTGNTFELKIDKKTSEKYELSIYDYIFCPNTEFGGIIEGLQVETNNEETIWFGTTFRGLLNQCIFKPQAETEIITGELNTALRTVLHRGNDAGNLFIPDNDDSGIITRSTQINGYPTKGEVLLKILSNLNIPRKLKISVQQGNRNEMLTLQLKTEEIKNYSELIEYSQDTKVPARIIDDRTGITHLLAFGKGNENERWMSNLWLDENGDISTIDPEVYTGAKNKSIFYEVSDSKTEEEFLEKAITEFAKMTHKKSISINDVVDVDADIGDIISGQDYTTKLSVYEPIIGKIVKLQKNGTVSIETKTEGSKK